MKKKIVTLKEPQVEEYIREYLVSKGWITTNSPKTVGKHGVDITARHPKLRKIFIIEVKGEGNSSWNQIMHNSFWTILGQILSRMDKEGNRPNKDRYYAIGIPKKWEKVFKHKILKMKFGWKFLKLKVFLVDDKGNVEQKPYSYFLR